MFCVLSSLPVIINKDQKRKDQMSPSTFSFKLVACNHWCTCYVESKSDSINLTWSTITFRINNIAALLVLFLYYPIINSKYAIFKEHCVKKCLHSQLCWSVFSRIRTEYGEIYGKIQTITTPNTDTLHAVQGSTRHEIAKIYKYWKPEHLIVTKRCIHIETFLVVIFHRKGNFFKDLQPTVILFIGTESGLGLLQHSRWALCDNN